VSGSLNEKLSVGLNLIVTFILIAEKDYLSPMLCCSDLFEAKIDQVTELSRHPAAILVLC